MQKLLAEFVDTFMLVLEVVAAGQWRNDAGRVVGVMYAPPQANLVGAYGLRRHMAGWRRSAFGRWRGPRARRRRRPRACRIPRQSRRCFRP
jgi:hypothetical protein